MTPFLLRSDRADDIRLSAVMCRSRSVDVGESTEEKWYLSLETVRDDGVIEVTHGRAESSRGRKGRHRT